ncbi:MAG TPA: 3-hydroxyacyl-ACP dehydratase FabZ [bacterium]|nr:3-hydroxyacyl-ACP dehydratase FabZ [bacterium]
MDIKEIMRHIPHRYPLILVDRILELDPGRRIVGLKNVSANEPFFVGHFPGHPVMPAVLIVEAMAQVGGVLASLLPGAEHKLAYFAALDRCRFRRPVRPGDQLITEVVVIRVRGRIGKMRVTSRVDGEVVADGVITYSMVDLEAVSQSVVDGQIVDLEEVEP